MCDGQLMPISENDTLFSLIGTTYGGDGQETFAMPDLRGRVPVHAGTRPGGSSYQIGQSGGAEEVTLTISQLPNHTHSIPASTSGATSASAVGGVPAAVGSDALWSRNPATDVMSTTSGAGGSQPHTNLQPYTCLNYIISLFGVFPSQS
jgi:microcystin-dependent protein